MPLETVTVFFDYLCPYAWRFSEVAEIVRKELGVRFEWAHFSLYQANHDADDGWQLWNDPVRERSNSGSRGLLPFLASLAAKRQGDAAHDVFRRELLRLRHVEHQPFHHATVVQAAERADLHPSSFERDLADPELRTALAQEHHAAVDAQVVATPTVAFDAGHVAYVRLGEVPADATEAVALYRSVRGVLSDHPYLETVRRIRPRGN
jgi:predicted DsbA family dithiol-disulfide isomerase